jgi:hypothetical protein
MSGFARFLGDSPTRVLIRLIVLSFIVGLVLSALHIDLYDITFWVRRTVEGIYDQGFAILRNGLRYLIVGALIVIPLFLLSRLFKLGGHRGD